MAEEISDKRQLQTIMYCKMREKFLPLSRSFYIFTKHTENVNTKRNFVETCRMEKKVHIIAQQISKVVLENVDKVKGFNLNTSIPSGYL